jgi:NAD(P)-dependent dehydrogenase (short-subunit alcohol dehydrogenase family)
LAERRTRPRRHAVSRTKSERQENIAVSITEHQGVAIELAGVAVVTGAGSGIGEATAKVLAQAGAHVVVADIAEDAAKRVTDEINEAGGSGLALGLDITDEAAVIEGLDRVRREVGPLRILVNNAAAWTVKSFADTEPTDVARVFAVTVEGTMNLTRHALEDVTAQPGGRVINIISDSGRVGEAYMSVYASAKAALMGFTKSLALEVGRRGTTVNGVSPGVTQTPGAEDFIAGAGGVDKLSRAYPMGRLGQPTDIANAVLFFASPYSSWITGQVLSVNGGYSMV